MDKDMKMANCTKCDTAMKMDEHKKPGCDKKACDK